MQAVAEREASRAMSQLQELIDSREKVCCSISPITQRPCPFQETPESQDELFAGR